MRTTSVRRLRICWARARAMSPARRCTSTPAITRWGCSRTERRSGGAEARPPVPAAQLGENRTEVAREDLAAGRPERVLRDGAFVARVVEVAADVDARLPARDPGVEDRLKRRRHELDAGGCCDRLGGRIGLRGGQAAVFVVVARDVAGREDVVEPVYGAEPARRDEAVVVGGNAQNPV